jgi:hypothetical protein
MRAALARMVAVLRGVTGRSGRRVGAARCRAPVMVVARRGACRCRRLDLCLRPRGVAWRCGLPVWLIGVDLLVTVGLYLAIGHLVPAAAIAGTVNWIALIASMTVVSAQLGGRPFLSVPLGLLVAAGAVTGLGFAHIADGLGGEGVLLTTQSVAAAAVMVAARRIERTAEAAFSDIEDATPVGGGLLGDRTTDAP